MKILCHPIWGCRHLFVSSAVSTSQIKQIHLTSSGLLVAIYSLPIFLPAARTNECMMPVTRSMSFKENWTQTSLGWVSVPYLTWQQAKRRALEDYTETRKGVVSHMCASISSRNPFGHIHSYPPPSMSYQNIISNTDGVIATANRTTLITYSSWPSKRTRGP